MPSPLVSVCLPNLNTRRFLPERMETILAQTLTDWELIVSDNYSDDGSWEFFQQFRTDPRVKLGQATRAGMYANWNECIRRATGEYVYLATSDDTMAPDCLERLLEPLERLPGVDLSVSDFELIDENSQPITERHPSHLHNLFDNWMTSPCLRNGQTEFLVNAALGMTYFLTITTVLMRRSLLDKTGLFRTDTVGSMADHEWAYRSALVSDIAYVPARLATWRISPGQATQKWDAKRHELCRNMLVMLRSVLEDPAAGIPTHWQSVPNWDREILELWTAEYRGTYNLYRNVAATQPREFFRNLGAALREDPGFVIQQIGRGFSWSPSFSPNRVRRAQELIELFHAAWPPVAVDSSWQPIHPAN